MSFLKNKLTVTVIVLSVSFLLLIGYTVKKENMTTAENSIGVVLNTVQGVVYKFNSKVKASINFIANFNEIKKKTKN